MEFFTTDRGMNGVVKDESDANPVSGDLGTGGSDVRDGEVLSETPSSDPLGGSSSQDFVDETAEGEAVTDSVATDSPEKENTEPVGSDVSAEEAGSADERKGAPVLRVVAGSEADPVDVEAEVGENADVVKAEGLNSERKSADPLLPGEDVVKAAATMAPLFGASDESEKSAPVADLGLGDSDAAVAAEKAAEEQAGPKVRVNVIIQEAREKAGLSLEDVSKDLRLNVNVLRAIEDMNPAAIGQRVYALGYIRDYASSLGLDPIETLEQYKSECAILADPVKKEIAPPAPKTSMPGYVAPLAGVGVLGVIAIVAGLFVVGAGGDKPAEDAVEVVDAGAAVGAAAEAAAARPTLRIVATSRARIEFRGADGTKFLARYFEAGESYAPRVGAGWTVTASDGDAFEWRMGNMSLGLLSDQGGAVYSQSVDAALGREPVPVVETIEEVVVPAPSRPAAPAGSAPAQSAPVQAAPRRSVPVQAAPPAATRPEPTPQPAPEELDPSLLAYPG